MLSRQRIRRWWSIGYLAVIETGRIEMTARARPPFDAELEPALEAAPAFFTTLEPDSIAEFRAATDASVVARRGHRGTARSRSPITM
jgi:hypothetical protein